MKALFSLIPLVIFSSLTACVATITDVGPDGNGNGGFGAGESYSQSIATMICDKQLECTGNVSATCKQVVNVDPNMTSMLGVSGHYQNFSELIAADSAGKVRVSLASYEICAKALKNLGCASDLAQNSLYRDMNLFNLLAVSQNCGTIFDAAN